MGCRAFGPVRHGLSRIGSCLGCVCSTWASTANEDDDSFVSLDRAWIFYVKKNPILIDVFVRMQVHQLTNSSVYECIFVSIYETKVIVLAENWSPIIILSRILSITITDNDVVLCISV